MFYIHWHLPLLIAIIQVSFIQKGSQPAPHQISRTNYTGFLIKDGIRVPLEHLLQSCNYIYTAKLFWKSPGFLGSHLFGLGAKD